MTDTSSIIIDEYMGFTWKNVHSSTYNCFIVNEDNGLTFVNAPSFSNQYASALYQNKSYFLGTSIERKSLTFKVACDRITLEEYRSFLKWLDIYSISNFFLDYDLWYGYNAKLAALTESQKYPMGKQMINGKMQMLFTVVLSITFETIEDCYALHKYITMGHISLANLNAGERGTCSTFNEDETTEISYYKSIQFENRIYLSLTNLGELDVGFQLLFNNINALCEIEQIDETLDDVVTVENTIPYVEPVITDNIGTFKINLPVINAATIEYDSLLGLLLHAGQIADSIEVGGQRMIEFSNMFANIIIPAQGTLTFYIEYTNYYKPDNATLTPFDIMIAFQKRTQVL